MLRFYFYGLLAVVAVIVQFAYIFRASISTTAGFTKPPLTACIASTKGGKPAGSTRDCLANQGPFCTAAQPCTPCSLGGCTPCALQSVDYTAGSAETGDCGFLPAVGPYCAYNSSAGSVSVSACTRCCT